MPLSPALAGEPGPGVWGDTTEDNQIRISLRKTDLERLAHDEIAREAAGPWYEYSLVSVCGGLPGTGGTDSLCGASFISCSLTDPEIGPGPALELYRREIDEHGASKGGPWESLGATCLPEMAPGGSDALTLAMIREAFHDTDFSVPRLNIQPEHDVTLVNLPTFFEVQFPEAGFGPDEVDTPDPARLLGYRIEVRPRLKAVTYHLGIRTIGPTTSLGGPHPTGDIRATYPQPGTHEVRVDVVYTGQFRVGGSQWFDIPGQVDLQGTSVTLTVREATSRLYTS